MRTDELRRTTRGVTLLELLTALAIFAVLAGAGAPALRDVSLNARRIAAINGLLGAIRFARNAALTRNATATLCRTTDGHHCAEAPADGTRWLIAVGEPGGASQTGTAEVVRVVDLNFSGEVTSNRPRFEFRPFPLRSTNGTIGLCDSRGGTQQRAIIISHTGRPRLAHPADETGLAACRTD